ncbi:hypothetical protein C6P42_000565 [Pichia californica]|nr:hypothetical protein C6P42_000565 [[Candida] californica]
MVYFTSTRTATTPERSYLIVIDNPVGIFSTNKEEPQVKEGAPINATKACETTHDNITQLINDNKTDSTEEATVSTETTIRITTFTESNRKISPLSASSKLYGLLTRTFTLWISSNENLTACAKSSVIIELLKFLLL